MQIELSGLSPYIVNALGIVLMALAGVASAAIIQIARKNGLIISAQMQGRIESYAEAGAKKAEEVAAARVRASLEPLSGAEKLQMAVDHVRANVPHVETTKAIDAVLAALPDLPGIGAVEQRGPVA